MFQRIQIESNIFGQMHLDGQVIVTGGQFHGDKTYLLGSRIDVEAEIFKILTPPLGYYTIKPLSKYEY